MAGSSQVLRNTSLLRLTSKWFSAGHHAVSACNGQNCCCAPSTSMIRFTGMRQIFRAVSAMPDGTYAATTNSDEEQLSHETIQFAQLSGADLGPLLKHHQASFPLKQAMPASENAEAERLYLAFHEEVIDRLFEFGLVSKSGIQELPQQNYWATSGEQSSPALPNTSGVSADQAETHVTSSTSRPQKIALNSEQQNVISAIKNIQTSQSKGLTNLLWLLGSIALFIVLGRFAWDWTFVLLLIPILFIHELGHFVAMRIFKYRNVRMFFIPLLGAAVSGRHFNVEGWKKVIVSLAGPLPGLLLAIPMSVALFWVDSELLRQLTLLTIILNLFNLLPFVPLDGGWVMHALYFCRTPVLDAVFRVVAALSLAGLGILLGSYFLMAFGGFMLFSLPLLFTHAKIADRLRQKNVPLAENDSDSLPVETAVQIINEIPTSGGLKGNAKAQANMTLQIYELISTQPPGALATAGLTLLYLSGWIVGGVGLIMLSIGTLSDRFMDQFEGFETSSIAVQSATIQSANELAGVRPDETVSGFAAEFETPKDAQIAFESIKTTGLPVLLMDRMLIASYEESSADGHQQEIENVKNNSIVFANAAERFYFFNVSGQADSETQSDIEDELRVLSQYSHECALFPSWDPNFDLNADQQACRSTLAQILKAERGIFEDQQYLDMTKQHDETLDQEDLTDDEINQEYERYNRAYRALRESRIRALLDQDGIRTEMVEHFLKRDEIKLPEGSGEKAYDAYDAAIKAWSLHLGAMAGRLPVNDATGKPNVGADRYALTSANVRSTEDGFTIQSLNFRQPVHGLPQLIKWLERQGATNIRFQARDPMSMLKENFLDATME